MPVVFGNSHGAPKSTGAATYVDTTYTCAVGDNRLLVVATYGGGVSAVSFGGVPLTNFAGYGMSFWRLVAPPTGAQTLRVTFPSWSSTLVIAVDLYGVDQSTPIGAISGASGTSNPSSPSITCPTDGLVIGFVASNWTSAGYSAKSGTTAFGNGAYVAGAQSSCGGHRNTTGALGWWGGDAAFTSYASGMPVNPYVVPAGSLIARRGGPRISTLLRM